LGRPVKWTEDRQEHFTAVNQERGQVHEVDVGFDAEGRVLALSDDFIHDGGAYTPYGIILPIITAAQIPGPYRLPSYRVRFRDLYTNATPTSPYRGPGRPAALFVMARTLDAIASDLNLCRTAVRAWTSRTSRSRAGIRVVSPGAWGPLHREAPSPPATRCTSPRAWWPARRRQSRPTTSRPTRTTSSWPAAGFL